MGGLGKFLSNAAFLLALVIWGGMVSFFTFVVTPVVFADLDRDTAARLLGDLFPRYFTLQVICVAVALAAAIGRLLWEAAPRRLAIVVVALLGVALLLALYGRFGILPMLQEAQARVPSFVTIPRDDPTRVAYGQLHGRAMILNATTALLGGATVLVIAFEPRLLHGHRTTRARSAALREQPGAPPARVTGPSRS